MPLAVIYGDGSRERRLFPLIAEKLGFSKEYVEPQLAVAAKGLDAVLSSIAAILGIRGAPQHYLVVIDREHVPSEHTLARRLAEHGFTLATLKTHLPERCVESDV